MTDHPAWNGKVICEEPKTPPEKRKQQTHLEMLRASECMMLCSFPPQCGCPDNRHDYSGDYDDDL